MSYYYNAATIVGVCLLVLTIVLFKKRIEIILNFILRCIFGAIGVYALNTVLAGAGLALQVGINPLSVLTCGILGLPGLGLLYAIVLYQLL